MRYSRIRKSNCIYTMSAPKFLGLFSRLAFVVVMYENEICWARLFRLGPAVSHRHHAHADFPVKCMPVLFCACAGVKSSMHDTCCSPLHADVRQTVKCMVQLAACSPRTRVELRLPGLLVTRWEGGWENDQYWKPGGCRRYAPRQTCSRHGVS